MTYWFQPEAERELEEAVDFYEQQETGLGIRFSLAVKAAIERAMQDPQSFPKTHVAETRFLVVKKFPYKIVFLIHDQGVGIYAVAHHKRRPGYWVHRLPESGH